MRVSLHTGALDELLGDWERLHAARADATPFLSAGWARAWWPHYGGRLLAVRVSDGGAVAGLAAFVVRRRGPLRVLEPVGLKPADYWDVLVAPGREAEVCGAVAEALARAARRWDAWILRCVIPGSPLVDALAARGLPALVRPAIPSPNLDLPDSFDAYLAGLSSNRRSNLRKHLRRLDAGEVELDDVTDVARLPDVVDRWRDFRRRQWDAAGKDINPEHLSDRFAAFMRDVLGELLPAGQGLAWEFRVGGEVVGTYLNFADDDAFHWYLGGFDPAVAKLGLGKIAIGHGIRTSIERGRRRYDFGPGAEEYKYWYGAVDRPLAAQVVGSPGVTGRVALAGAGAVLRRRGPRA